MQCSRKQCLLVGPPMVIMIPGSLYEPKTAWLMDKATFYVWEYVSSPMGDVIRNLHVKPRLAATDGVS